MAILLSVLFTLQLKVDGTLRISEGRRTRLRELAASPFPASSPFPAWYTCPPGTLRFFFGMGKRIPRSGGHRQYELRPCFHPLVSPELDVIRCRFIFSGKK